MRRTELDNLGEYYRVVIVTDHSDYNYQRIVQDSRLVVDTCNATGIQSSNVVRA